MQSAGCGEESPALNVISLCSDYHTFSLQNIKHRCVLVSIHQTNDRNKQYFKK